MFPFLIGRIRTREERTLVRLFRKFPFLIGRIRTARISQIAVQEG